MNNLPKVCVNSKVTFYAADFSLLSTEKMVKNARENNLGSIIFWLIENKLNLNQDKTKNIEDGSKSTQMINSIVETLPKCFCL